MNPTSCLIKTDRSIAPLILRLTLALVLFPHGAQKLLGWWGGYGYGGTMQFFTQTMHIPTVFAFLAIMIEFFAPLVLAAGLLTRLTALIMGAHMAVAMYLGHLPFGFFMNWTGQQKGEGFEFHLLYIGVALALVIAGGGRCSVDAALQKPAPPA